MTAVFFKLRLTRITRISFSFPSSGLGTHLSPKLCFVGVDGLRALIPVRARGSRASQTSARPSGSLVTRGRAVDLPPQDRKMPPL